jgi:hypothetical protein
MDNKMNGFKGLATRVMTAVSTLAILAAGAMVSERAIAEVPAQLADGTYLYGESDQPNQAEVTYFVFEVKQGNVQGALYEQLSLKILNTYEKTETPLQVALDRTSLVASSNNTPMLQVGLQGLKSVGSLSDLDRSILATCKVALSTRTR